MKKRFRKWIAGVLSLVPIEEIEPLQTSSWEQIEDVWACKNHKVTWPRVTVNPIWRTELEPYFRQMLLSSLVRLAHEKDPEQLRMLQERAKLLNEWLETPRLAEVRMNAALDNALGSGSKMRLATEMERANAGR